LRNVAACDVVLQQLKSDCICCQPVLELLVWDHDNAVCVLREVRSMRVLPSAYAGTLLNWVLQEHQGQAACV
jgi:hypothetical protein